MVTGSMKRRVRPTPHGEALITFWVTGPRRGGNVNEAGDLEICLGIPQVRLHRAHVRPVHLPDVGGSPPEQVRQPRE